MTFTVCILAAGFSRPIGDFSDYVNKAVLPVGNKAILSRIIEKFPGNTRFVVAVGHRKDSVIDYLELAYPEKDFIFVDVEHYVGEGAGPATSLLECKDHLQCPFILTTADTLVTEDVPPPDENWFGISPIPEEKTEKYCTVQLSENKITRIDDKVKTDNTHAFIGIASVKDHEKFFLALQLNREKIKGEIQLSNGFKALLPLQPKKFTWLDTGSLEGYRRANSYFSETGFDFSKNNEFLYFVNDKVIKFFGNEDIAEKRVKRAKMLYPLVPEIEGGRKHFYSYGLIPGDVMYDTLSVETAERFFRWAHDHLWKEVQLADRERFEDACKKFYYEKTLQRIKSFYAKTDVHDTPLMIDEIEVPPLKELLEQVPWHSLYDGTPCTFHGDLQFDNILVKPDDSFVLLDWRQDFGDMTDAGDLYYDLGKLYGGMTISYRKIKNAEFSLQDENGNVTITIPEDGVLSKCRDVFEDFVRDTYDMKKICILRALIFLNMSPLHHEPFDKLLYYLGRKLLYLALQDSENEHTEIRSLEQEEARKEYTPKLCVGPMSKTIVDTILDFSFEQNIPMNIIASRAQIETEALGGGYANAWTTEDFAAYVKKRKSRRPADVTLCRDHGGPWLGRGEKELALKYAMLSAKASFEADIAGGFGLIHIDTSRCENGRFNMREALRRAFELLLFCEEKAAQYGTRVEYEIGTEDADGGIVDPQSFAYYLKQIVKFCEEENIPKPKYIVGRTGTLVKETRQAGTFNFENTKRLVKIAEKYGVGIKEHNVDYDAPENLRLRQDAGVAAINVAPEFGVIETKAFIDYCEKHEHEDIKKQFLDLAYESKCWRKWIIEPDMTSREQKSIIAGHYVFGTKEFSNLKKELGPDLDEHLQKAIWNRLEWYVKHLYPNVRLVTSG